MPPGRLAAPLVSMVFTEPPPPEPSMMRMMGKRKSCAISSAISGLALIEASAEPPRTVKSSPTTTTVRPSILPRPNTQLAGVKLVSWPSPSYSPTPAMAPTSWKLFGSISLSMRSRTVSRPWSRCRLTLSTPPISRAKASRRARSSSSGFQFILVLRLDDFIVMRRHRKRLALDPIEDIRLGAVEQVTYGDAQLQKPRCYLAMKPRFVEHRRQQADRHHDEGLVLRRPHRHRQTVDVRAPQSASHDIDVFAQELAVGLDTRPQQFGAIWKFTRHFHQQRVADIDVEGRGIGVAGCGGRHRNAAAGALVQAERVGGAAVLEIDQMKAVRNDKTDGAGQLLGDILQPLPDQVAQLQAPHHRSAHCDCAGADAVFL